MNRTEFIHGTLKEHYNDILSERYEIMCVVLQGSQNYNLDIYDNTYQSDIDTRAIILPSFKDFCDNNAPISTTYVRHNQEHIDIKDIRSQFDMFKKQNINALEILFSPYYIVNEKYLAYWKRLRRIRERLTHCDPIATLTTMWGTCLEKRKILCRPSSAANGKVEKYGYDGKQLYTILRINEFMRNYLDGMSFERCLVTHTSQSRRLMLDAKLNVLPCDEALELADDACSECERLKNDFATGEKGTFDPHPYSTLEEIKSDILRYRLKSEL